MKIKEIDRTGNVAWSPKEVEPIYLAVGTAAQQLDSTFSTNSVLEIYHFDINQSGLDLPVKATLPCESRFHKLVWGSHGISTGEGANHGEHPTGVIVGGCDNGVIQVYDAAKILKNENPLMLSNKKHTGAVKALDFNPFRSNLVASGASESEIYIWDLTNMKTPMTPGTKVQPADDVTHLSWNKRVEHILASTFPTRCVVWDLRKNEPVIKVSDTTSRIRYKVVEWHPEVATQMCLASEDDNSPVIQLWDLRYATAPLKVIHGHQRGILGMAWCAQDSDLLLTCGKESRILCWNPNFVHPGYEMVCDIPTASQYSFDVSFCPKNPIVIASSSFDGRVSIFGLSGGVQHPVTSSKLTESFPGMDMTLAAPVPTQQPAFLQLRDAPKWLKRPCGASFAFGGKLITFNNIKSAAPQPNQPPITSGIVNISQLVTLPELIERSKKLEETLQSGSLEGYCAHKAGESGDGNETKIWEFLQANFSQNPREAYLDKLGFHTSEMLNKLGNFSWTGDSNDAVNGLADDFENFGRGAPDGFSNGFDIDRARSKSPISFKEFAVLTSDSSVDGKINQALLCGSIETAVHICLEDERWADALLLATKASPELLAKTQQKYFEKSQSDATQVIRAVVTHDLNRLVERCQLESWKEVLAIVTTYAEQNEFSLLADKLGQRLQTSKTESQKLGALLCCICSGNLNHLVDVWVGDSDKHRGDTPDELQDLVEQVMILKKAGELWGRETNVDGGPLASKLVEYASLLASQGCLELALNFLGESSDPMVENLKQRLYYSLRYTRPTRSQIQPRSRQSSDSSLRSASFTKRPSYPSANNNSHAVLSRGSSSGLLNLNATDFSNLTGPIHPPSASTGMYGPSSQPQYGNVYVNSNVPSTVGQFTPPLNQSGYGAPVPPNNQPPAIYNPGEVPVNNSNSGQADPNRPPRVGLGSSLPQPPVSSAAHGWNDPPQINYAASQNVPPKTTSANPPIYNPAIYNPAVYNPATDSQTNHSSSGYNNEHLPPPPRIGLGSSLPKPPMTSAPSWNDPPIKFSNLPTGATMHPPSGPGAMYPPSGHGAMHSPPGTGTINPPLGPGTMNPPPTTGLGAMHPPPPTGTVHPPPTVGTIHAPPTSGLGAMHSLPPTGLGAMHPPPQNVGTMHQPGPGAIHPPPSTFSHLPQGAGAMHPVSVSGTMHPPPGSGIILPQPPIGLGTVSMNPSQGPGIMHPPTGSGTMNPPPAMYPPSGTMMPPGPGAMYTSPASGTMFPPTSSGTMNSPPIGLPPRPPSTTSSAAIYNPSRL